MLYILDECGKRIAKLRIQHGYTQERLADVLNIDRSFLSKVEAGKKGFSIDLLVQLSALFDVSLDYLIVGRIRKTEEPELKQKVEELISHLTAFREKL